LRLTILGLSLVFGLAPLAGIGWIFATGMLAIWPPSATVDGLFMTLILLAVSSCLLLNAYWEARDQGLLKFLQKEKPKATNAPALPAKAAVTAKATTPATPATGSAAPTAAGSAAPAAK
jgi:hypothetical protein